MNPEPHILPLPSEPTEPPQPNDSSLEMPASNHRGNGKIARLPKTVRDQINNWILDGLSYPDIIERLGEQGEELKPGHLCEYKKRGHQDWLRQREWFEHITAKSEFSKDLLAAPDTTALHEAGLRMAAAQMIDQLMRFSAAADAESTQPDPEQFARLVNALSRLTREALSFQKYHDTTAKAQPAEPKHLDPAQKPSQKAQDMLLNGWRNFFGHDLTQPMPDVGRQTSPSADSAVCSPSLPSLHTPTTAAATPSQPSRAEADTASTDPTTETHANLQKPNSNSAVPTSPSEILNLESEIPPPPSQSEFENQNSQPEHCLECLAPLPTLRPDNRRPWARCENCGCKLPPPGTCVEPSIERCPNCRANLPRVLPGGERPSTHCHRCGTPLPPPEPAAPSPPGSADLAITNSLT